MSAGTEHPDDIHKALAKLWVLAMETGTDRAKWRFHLDADSYRLLTYSNAAFQDGSSTMTYEPVKKWRDIPIGQHYPDIADALISAAGPAEPIKRLPKLIAIEVRWRGFSHYIQDTENDPMWIDETKASIEKVVARIRQSVAGKAKAKAKKPDA